MNEGFVAYAPSAVAAPFRLTDSHVIEVDHARKYRAAIKQALRYAGATKKKPGVALIMDGTQDTLQAVEAAKRLCEPLAKRL